jgi:hypothetical protein
MLIDFLIMSAKTLPGFQVPVVPLFLKTRKSYLQVSKCSGKFSRCMYRTSMQNQNPILFEFWATQKWQNMINYGVLKIYTVQYTQIHISLFLCG